MDKNSYFRTTNWNLSCFLFCRGLQLVGIEEDPSNTKRKQFVFLDTPQRASLVHNFNFAKEDSPEILTDARKLILAIKTLKDKLYQNNY